MRNYYELLVAEYPKDVYEVYQKLILDAASSEKSNKTHRRIIELLRALINSGGTEKAQLIIARLHQVSKGEEKLLILLNSFQSDMNIPIM